MQDVPGTSTPTGALRPRSGARDRCVDLGMVLLALAFSVAVAGERLTLEPAPTTWVFTADQAVAVLGSLSLWWRRRWPVALAVGLVLLSAVSGMVAGAMLLAVFTLAVHLPVRTTAWVGAMSVVTAVVHTVLRPEPDVPPLAVLGFGLAVQGAAIGWGLFVRHRRALHRSILESAAQGEATARLRAQQEQRQARDELAREIHDGLGHRLSLLGVHAGALEYRTDASAAEVASSAAVIRENAHAALQDLRDLIGLLRAPVGELPLPRLSDLDDVVGAARTAGTPVELAVDGLDGVPDRLGRDVVRIVQEGLTNVRKHAPGAATQVRLSGQPGGLISVDVQNAPAPVSAGPVRLTPTGPAAPGRGRGLTGVAERAAAVGGRAEHGRTADGGWRLAAWLPWPT